MLDAHFSKGLDDFILQIDFELGAGILVLFGPSGAGKTMTLNCLAGLVQPDAGTIRLNARVLFDSNSNVHVPTRERRVGYVFQHYALFPHLTVRENIGFGLRGQDKVTQRIDEVLELTRLTEFGRRYPLQLSGGQQQRVALARALAPKPDLLLLDEPFSALDVPTRTQLRNELCALQNQFRIPMVFVTHDLGEAYFLGDKIAVIIRGKVLQLGAPGEVLRQPATLDVARVVGVRNILPGAIVDQGEGVTRVQAGNVILEAPRYPFEKGTRVHICLRSERIVLLRPERAGRSNDENPLSGEIIREMSDGMNVKLYFRAEGARLAPDSDYDLQIELPVYIYERLDLAHQRQWSVSLRRNAIHLIPG